MDIQVNSSPMLQSPNQPPHCSVGVVLVNSGIVFCSSKAALFQFSLSLHFLSCLLLAGTDDVGKKANRT